MALTTTTASPLTPEQVAELVTIPVETTSVAMQIATSVATASHRYRIPRMTDDPTAGWIAEGAEITPSDAGVDELVVVPSKVAALSIISNELADDSSPDAAKAIGAGMVRDVAKAIDKAFFSTVAAPAPAGLQSLSGVTVVSTPTGETTWADLDVFTEGVYEAEQLGAQLGAWCANPTDAKLLATLKDQTGSNRPLLGVDPSVPTRRTIQGIPLFTDPNITVGTVWGIPALAVWVVRRTDVALETDRSVFFTSDRTAIKTTMRIGFGFVAEAAVIKVELATT